MKTKENRGVRVLPAALLVLLCCLSVRALSETWTGTVNADKVLFRMQANTSCDYYDRLGKGTKVELLEARGDFYKAKYGVHTGYLMKKFVSLSSAARVALDKPASAENTAKASATKSSDYIGTVNKDDVFFRMRADADSGYYARLNKGDKVALLDIRGEYYKVRVGNQTGYVMKQLVSVTSSVLEKFTGSVTPESTSKYAKTATISGLGDPPGNLQNGDSGTDVEKLQRALQLKRCYTGSVDGKFGAMTATALKAYQKANGLSVNGRADYPTIKKLFGRVSETTAAEDPKMKGITSISQISLPNTTARGDSGQHVTALQQALKLKGFYKPPIDGSYGDGTYQAVLSFQKQYGLSRDGEAGNATIKKLFGKDAANHRIETERLNWFNGGSSVIPKGAVFTVKDVMSGTTFTCKRWSGVNHIDAEPVDSASASKMKSAYGGSWSWARRPILVRYNGHVYAASMNGMPHGTDTISGNGFAGHFCIHFYNSRTHDTNKVDTAHQNAVLRAMGTSW